MYIALSGLRKEDRRCKTLIQKCIPTKNYGVGTGGNVPAAFVPPKETSFESAPYRAQHFILIERYIVVAASSAYPESSIH